MRILLVEDEINLAMPLTEILKRNNYEVECVHDGKAGLHLAMSGIFDIVLLDVMLPKLSGFEILKKLRKSDTETPVILLTARNSVSDKITGLDYGADDYLPKPFNTDELLARIRVALRKKGKEVDAERFEFSDVTLFPTLKKLIGNTKEVELSERENLMMTFFLRNETSVMPFQSILDNVWGEEEADETTIHKYVGFLKKKLQFIESDINILEIRGVGYKLIPQRL